MRSTPRLVVALALGGTLLSLSPTGRGVYADPAPAPSAPAAPETTPAPVKPSPVQTAPESAAETRETEEEQRFVELLNQERVRRGLRPLTVDPVLIRVAREHSAEMRDKSYFNHTSPTSGIETPMARYLRACSARPEYACVGENLFYCSIVDVQRGHNAFMNSPTHRENVLFPRYERIGVGIIKNDRGEFWVTQMFITNRDPVIVAKKVSSR